MSDCAFSILPQWHVAGNLSSSGGEKVNSYIDDLLHSVLILSRNPGWEGLLRRCSLERGSPHRSATFLQRQEEEAGSCSDNCSPEEAGWKRRSLCFSDWLLLGNGCSSLEAAKFCDLGICRPQWLAVCPSSEWCRISGVLCLPTFSVLMPCHTFLFSPPQIKNFLKVFQMRY